MDPSQLVTTGMLSEVADEDRAVLAQIMRLEERPRGNVLVEKGDIPDRFSCLSIVTSRFIAEAERRESFH